MRGLAALSLLLVLASGTAAAQSQTNCYYGYSSVNCTTEPTPQANIAKFAQIIQERRRQQQLQALLAQQAANEADLRAAQMRTLDAQRRAADQSAALAAEQRQQIAEERARLQAEREAFERERRQMEQQRANDSLGPDVKARATNLARRLDRAAAKTKPPQDSVAMHQEMVSQARFFLDDARLRTSQGDNVHADIALKRVAYLVDGLEWYATTWPKPASARRKSKA